MDADGPRSAGSFSARAHVPGTSSTLTGSAALSLVELRRHLLRRAGELNAQSRQARTRGDGQMAARLGAQAAAIVRSAHRMDAH